MSNDIGDIRTALKAQIGAGIPTLHAEKYYPDAINFPVAFPLPKAEDFLVDMAGDTEIELYLVVLAGAARVSLSWSWPAGMVAAVSL